VVPVLGIALILWARWHFASGYGSPRTARA
jgi:hypothetical protein